MTSSFSSSSPQDFALEEFGACDLGDLRRTRRLVSIASAIAHSPGKSICRLFSGSYAMNAAYEFFKQD
ncbi:MAG: transposase DNA-binding-containing protein [Sumerlaeia bacterium]